MKTAILCILLMPSLLSAISLIDSKLIEISKIENKEKRLSAYDNLAEQAKDNARLEAEKLKKFGKFEKFKAAFETHRQNQKEYIGFMLFTRTRDMGDGIVAVTVSSDFLKLPYDMQKAFLKEVFDLWDKADGSGLPIAVYAYDSTGKLQMKKARGL